MKTLRRFFAWTKSHRWYVAAFFLLVLSFNLNIMGLGPNEGWFDSFQDDSEAIVYKTIECGGVVDGYAGPLASGDPKAFSSTMLRPGCTQGAFSPYGSQFGLQSRTFSALKPSFISNGLYIKIAELLLTVVTALMIVMLVRRLEQEFGQVVAVSVYGLTVFSPWIAGYARNMYWVIFTVLLPFVFSMLYYKKLKDSGRLHVFYGILFALFLLKLLNGYEYASTIFVSAFVPIVYYELAYTKVKVQKLWKQALAVLITGVAAIVIAIGANIVGLKEYADSWTGAYRIVAGRAEDRSNIEKYKNQVVGQLARTAPEAKRTIERFYNVDQLSGGEGSTIKFIAISAINYMMLPAITLPFLVHEPLATIMQSILLMIIVSWLCLRMVKTRVKGREGRKIRAIIYCYWLSLAGAMSWLVLMPGHTFVHPHINAIVFYVPFMFFAYISIGLYIDSRIKKRHKLPFKKYV